VSSVTVRELGQLDQDVTCRTGIEEAVKQFKVCLADREPPWARGEVDMAADEL